MSGFRDTDEFEKTWNCRFSGTKKEKTLKNFEANEKSFLIGWYQGSRQFKKDNKTYIIHKMLVKPGDAGDPKHLSAEIKNPAGEVIEFFGTTVLNKKLGEKVQPGQFIKVTWKGKVTETKNGGDPYDDWGVGIDSSIAPLIHSGESTGNAPAPSENKMDKGGAPSNDNANTTASAENTTANAEDDDDLPF